MRSTALGGRTTIAGRPTAGQPIMTAVAPSICPLHAMVSGPAQGFSSPSQPRQWNMRLVFPKVASVGVDCAVCSGDASTFSVVSKTRVSPTGARMRTHPKAGSAHSRAVVLGRDCRATACRPPPDRAPRFLAQHIFRLLEGSHNRRLCGRGPLRGLRLSSTRPAEARSFAAVLVLERRGATQNARRRSCGAGLDYLLKTPCLFYAADMPAHLVHVDQAAP